MRARRRRRPAAWRAGEPSRGLGEQPPQPLEVLGQLALQPRLDGGQQQPSGQALGLRLERLREPRPGAVAGERVDVDDVDAVRREPRLRAAGGLVAGDLHVHVDGLPAHLEPLTHMGAEADRPARLVALEVPGPARDEVGLEQPREDLRRRPRDGHRSGEARHLGVQPPAGLGPRAGRSGTTSASADSRPCRRSTSRSSSAMRADICFIASAIGSGRWTQSASGPSGRIPSTRTTWPGLPTTVEFGGTSWMTTALAPTLAPWPIVIGPRSFAPEPIVTLSCTVGWRFPRAKPVPPRVTPWYMVTSSPISAVSPITTPMPWSMNSPRPIRAAGWISTPVIVRVRYAIARGSRGTPARARAWAMRCASSAWTPGQAARIPGAATPVAAGSRSWAARTSRRTSLTTSRTVEMPVMSHQGYACRSRGSRPGGER